MAVPRFPNAIICHGSSLRKNDPVCFRQERIVRKITADLEFVKILYYNVSEFVILTGIIS